MGYGEYTAGYTLSLLRSSFCLKLKLTVQARGPYVLETRGQAIFFIRHKQKKIVKILDKGINSVYFWWDHERKLVFVRRFFKFYNYQ
jgi:hypothetical protein